MRALKLSFFAGGELTATIVVLQSLIKSCSVQEIFGLGNGPEYLIMHAVLGQKQH